ncbi:response regulator transcription factor [Streptomyces sp. NPDC041068]|uniref:response regulator transcription factor n=1 Tax=Streptomyces sp. NPDC041068 TaxID=3155130 RepID=UPI0033E296DF
MIRVLLAEDESLIRGALMMLLRSENGVEIVAETGEGRAVLPLALKHRPDVAVLDVNMPDMSGLDAAAQLREQLPQCRILLVTSLDRPGVIRRAMDLSVDGYLLKDTPPDEFAQAIHAVAAGRRVVDSTLLMDAWRSPRNPLTPRETEVLQLAAAGHSVPGIAAAVGLSLGTVRNYLSNAVSKLGARTRQDAVRLAQEAGWLLPVSSGADRQPAD